MHVMRESWTDARPDDFRDEVNRRFDEVDRRFGRVEGEIRELRIETKADFESIHKLMFQSVIALSAAYLAGFAALVTLIATQL